jgi:hypothetical protein
VNLSHVALNVGRGEGPLAERFLRHLGLLVTDNGPSLLGDPWYTAVVDPEHRAGDLAHLGFFVIPVSDAQRALEEALRDAPVEEYLAEKRRKPDSNGHVALNYERLEELEDAVRALAADGDLAARVSALRFRPEAAPEDVAARLDASDVFADATPVRYLDRGVQVFLQTDLVAVGLLRLGQSFELNATL